MNFLELAQSVAKNSVVGGTPTSVPNATGAHGRVIEWVNQGWLSLQRKYANWDFMRRSFSVDTTIGQWSYTPAQMLANAPATERYIGKWCNRQEMFRIYLKSAGQTAEVELEWEEWSDFKRTYRIGAQTVQTGAPSCMTVQPDKSIGLWPAPNDVYTITGDYWMAPRPMALDNSSVPWMPEQFHEAIVWHAIMQFGGFEEGSAIYVHAQNMLEPIMSALIFDQLPDLEMGEPLA